MNHSTDNSIFGATLYVRDFVKGGTFPTDLRIFIKPSKSKSIYAKWMPLASEDPRPNQGRIKGSGKTKRTPIEASMQTDDPIEAAKRAIKWFKKTSKDYSLGVVVDNDYSLSRYWEIWSVREFEKPRRNKQSVIKFRRDTQLKWDANEWGVANQDWAKKSVDEINHSDFADYFSLLEARAKKNNGSNGSGMKEQQKAFIRALMKEARIDFPNLQIPDFPSISRQTKQVAHLNHDQWDLLIRRVKEQCDFVVNKEMNYKQYQSLPSTYKRENQRNWVDLYDALLLEYFYFLRSEDMYRLRSEWFQDNGKGEYQCLLKETKQDRDVHLTQAYRFEADGFMRRMKERRPKKGYLIFPLIRRPDEGGAENKVRNLLNHLLKKTVEKCLPDFSLRKKPWTTIRHTTIRLMLEDDPSLWVGYQLRDFAANCHTSPEQILTTYIQPIQAGQTAKATRENLRVKGWKSGSRVRV